MTNHPSSSSLLLLLLNIALTIATFFMNINPCHASRKPASLYHPPPQLLTYHHGPLLQGPIPLSILWYGHFSIPQKSIITDFILSLTPPHQLTTPPTTNSVVPTVSKWWKTVHLYLQMARKNNTLLFLSAQTTDPKCSLGKSLSRTQLSELAARTDSGGLALILTAEDVTVEGFCMSSCGLHSSLAGREKPYVWVGNSATQCPGQCAWPFHESLYGPRGPPLGAPNGDVGADGMVINLGTLLAGAVTNPFGSGFFGGPGEVVGACAGVFGKGAYPGYAGELRVDLVSGGSYNVEGVRGRKYLVPAMLDPSTYTCSPVV